MIYIACALVLPILGYVALVRKEMRREPAVRYNRVVAWWLRRLLPKKMRALSAWRTCWMLYPPTDPRGKMSQQGRSHEFDGHILNPNQWAGHPYSFPFRYLWRLRKYGYAKHPDEQEARRIAGEPER